MTRYNLSFAGAGRVAGALCSEMFHRGHNIIRIVSKSEAGAKKLADSCNASWSTSLDFNTSNDIIIVAVPDSSLKEVLSKIRCSDKTLVVHTAGSFGLDVFPAYLRRTGVFYPLQTFTRGRKIDFNNLPFLIESSGKDTSTILENMAISLGGKSYFIDTENRRMIHLSAVFACNFSNFMLTAGKNLTSKAGLPFEILKPLIKETISKALESGPEISQTGPALRNDRNTIEKHLELLSFSPELQSIYRDVTQAIINYYNKA